MDILNRNIIRVSLPILLSLPLCGCYSDFEPDIESTPVVCINSLVTAGDTVTANVTRTWRWSEGNVDDDGQHGLDIYLPDAEVRLYVNGAFVENMTYREETNPNHWYRTDRYFTSSHVARVGEEIEFRVTDRKYGEASGKTVVPGPVNFEKVDVDIYNLELTGWKDENQFSCTFGINILASFTDPVSDVNFYDFEMNAYSPPGYWETVDNVLTDYIHSSITMIGIDYENEPLFTEHQTPLESAIADNMGYTIFTDRQISGKSYALHCGVREMGYSVKNLHGESQYEDAGVVLSLSNITKSYYDHVLSIWQTDEGVAGALAGVGLGNSVSNYSNVSTGAGIVAARYKSSYTLRLHHLLLNKLDRH